MKPPIRIGINLARPVICKIFPDAQVGGPAFVKAVKGPMPWTELMPTGGVSPMKESLTEWCSLPVLPVRGLVLS